MRFKSDVGSSPPPFKRVVRATPLGGARRIMKNNSELICESEKVYSFCWNILSRVKKGLPQENRTDLGMFQIRLARILFQLEKRQIQISQEINEDKKTKKSSLLLEKKRLTQCINIGKAIGDAFAWIFYVHSQDLLEKHQSQQSNGPSPATKGIYAEILFLEKYQLDNGYFYIYHGITTSYRLGDFSIYDISKGKIIGIIELKTKFPEPRRISQEINVIFSSDLSTEYIKALNIENKRNRQLIPPFTIFYEWRNFNIPGK